MNRKVYRKDGKMIEYTYTQYDPYGKQLKEIFENYVHMIKEIKPTLNMTKKETGYLKYQHLK